MTDRPSATGDAPDAPVDDEWDPVLRDPAVRAWFEEHQMEMRRNVSGQHFLYWSLGIGFVVGLAAHIGGYLLRTSATGEPLAVVADLLYALGWALWTGVVVVVFVQVIPEAKRRQVKKALDAFDAARRAEARSDDRSVTPAGGDVSLGGSSPPPK
jgi:hypothetical protein